LPGSRIFNIRQAILKITVATLDRMPSDLGRYDMVGLMLVKIKAVVAQDSTPMISAVPGRCCLFRLMMSPCESLIIVY
jgi:hypothetical protein